MTMSASPKPASLPLITARSTAAPNNEKSKGWATLDHKSPVWKSKFYGAFVLNHRVVLHAIDATSARWRGDAGSSPLDRARTVASVHPTNWLISTQVIVVGAVPDAVQVDQLDRAFAPYFRKGAARPWPRAPEAFFPDPSSFGAAVFAEAPRRRVRASVFEDAEATSAFAAVSVAKRYEAATTVGGFRRWLVGDVSQNVVNRQLAKLAMASAPPFSSASVGAQPPVALRRASDGIQGVTVSMLSAVPLAHDRVADALRSAWRVVVEKRDRVTADELRMARRRVRSAA